MVKTVLKCQHCDKYHKGAGDGCWSLEKNKDKRPEGYKVPGKLTNTETVELKSQYNPSAEIARDRKRQKVSSHIYHTKNASNATWQETEQHKKWKRVLFAQNEISVTNSDVDCDEVANPMVALFETNTETLDSNSNSNSASDFEGYKLPEYLNPFFDRGNMQKKAKVSIAD